ncbi:metalloprotease [Clostridium omnivorum]|uniref:Metalloprotease n=1 Tax=Clostridium omnivorum TaxID=1604902 RepID=A0ABQ5N8M4_9CLOT|nr:metalloprotease [Clostridium sp. E14]
MTKEAILAKILLIPGILIGFTFHEYAHAIMADKLGDKTPRFQGRLTLNPFVHIDPIGFIMIILIGFGWAKPVETNPSAFKKYYKDDLKVSIAGPIANLIVAFVAAIFTAVFFKYQNTSNLLGIVFSIFLAALNVNCMLFVINLIPIPGFDGFHILRDLFPKFFYKISDSLYRYQFIIMILFIIVLGDYLVGYPTRYLMYSLLKLTSFLI